MSFFGSVQSLASKVGSKVQKQIQKAEETLETALNSVVGADEKVDDSSNDIAPLDDGINSNLLDFVTRIVEHPKTFTDFPLQNEKIINLNQWQIRHCKVLLQKIPD